MFKPDSGEISHSIKFFECSHGDIDQSTRGLSTSMRLRQIMHPRQSLLWVIITIILGIISGFIILFLGTLRQHQMLLWAIVVVATYFIALVMMLTRNIKKILLVCLILIFPIAILRLHPFDADMLYRPSGAPAGFLFYLYDFPLIAILIVLIPEWSINNKKIFTTKLDLLAILLIVWSVITCYISSQIILSVFEILRIAKLYLLARVVSEIINTKRDMQLIINAILIGVVLQSLIAVLQYSTGTDLGLGLFTVSSYRRVTGTMYWPNTIGAYAAALSIFGFAVWSSDTKQIIAGISCIAGFCLLVLSFSRGAWFAALAGIMIVLGLHYINKNIKFKSIFSLVILFFSLTFVFSQLSGDVIKRIQEINPNMLLDKERVLLNEVAINMIQKNPIFGIGINTFLEEMGRYDTTGVSVYFHQPVHNVYLLIAAETGLVGFCLFILLILEALRQCWISSRSNDHYIYSCAVGTLGALVALAITNLADVHLKTEVLFTLFWLLIGLANSLRKVYALPPVSIPLKIES